MDITLYHMKKRLSDVRGPYASDSFRKLSGVYLKDNSSIVNPTLILRNVATGTGTGYYNYVYIPQFKRYYWVEDWKYKNPNWEIVLTVDPLASFEDDILDSTQYVVRSENGFTATITDTLYPASNELTSDTRTPTAGAFWGDLKTSGCYIVGVRGKGTALDTLETGMVNYFSMDFKAFASFRSAVYDDTLAFYTKNGDFGDVSTAIAKLLVDINEYVVSCVFVPYQPVGISISTMSIGFWTWTVPSGATVKQVEMFTAYHFNRSIYLPKHPDYSDYGFYLNGSGFSAYTLHVPGVGTLPLDADALIRANSVVITMDGDSYSGAGLCKVSAIIGDSPSNDTVIELYNLPINLAVPVTLSGSENATGSLLSGAANIVSSFANRDVIGALGNAVDSTTRVPGSSTSVVGSNTSFESLRTPCYVQGVFNKPANRDTSVFGRPCCRAIQLRALGVGYAQCSNAHVSIAGASADEIKMIEDYLNQGVYLFAYDSQ